MSQTNNTQYITRPANTDLSAKQYYCVELNTSNKALLAGANDKAVIGVLQNDPEADEAALIAVGGTCKVIAGEAITIGDHVTVTSTGKVEIADAADEYVIGKALETASADGDIIEILIVHGYVRASDA
jgi:hypothetical protein